jgi:hypothetical protein
LYYEGKEFELDLKERKAGMLSQELMQVNIKGKKKEIMQSYI